MRDRLLRGWRWLRPGAADRRLDDEIRFHLEREAEEYERSGLSPEAARREALRQFGGIDRHTEATRDVRPTRWLEDLVRDVRVGARSMLRDPGYALVAAAALAVGIGSSTFVYSAVRAVLIEPLPYPNTDRVVTLWETNATTGEDHLQTSPGNVLEWLQRNRSFERIALAEPSGGDIVVEGRPVAIPSWAVSEGWFEAFGVRPALGRIFTPEEYADSLRSALMISWASWQSRFGGDPDIVGKTIEVERAPRTIVGVLPRGFDYPTGVPGDGGFGEPAKELWQPRAFQPGDAGTRSGNWMPAVGLLRSGVGPQAAQADLDRVAAQLAAESPSTNANLGVRVIPLRDEVLGDAKLLLSILAGVVAVLLLLAATNTASLVLARAMARQREFAIRGAVGAGRGRLARQVLAESALLVGLGAVAGVAIAWAAVELFGALAAGALPRAANVRLDGGVLLFALALAAVVTGLAGLLPALRVARGNTSDPMRFGPRVAGGGRGRSRMQSALVVVQTALALVLVIGGALLARSFLRLLDNDLGFEPEGLATVQAFIYDITDGPEDRVAFVRDALDRMRSLPGASGAAMVSAFPFHPEQIDQRFNFTVVGRPPPAGAEPPSAQATTVSPEYFGLMGIPLLQGRYFDAFDRADWDRTAVGRSLIGGAAPADQTRGGRPVAIVSESVARRHWPGEDPVGARIRGVREGSPDVEVVGVVGDVRPYGYDTDPRPEIYFPHAWNGTGAVTFVARARPPRGAPALVDAMREVVWAIAPSQSIYYAGTSRQMIARTLAVRRFNLALMIAFAGVALALALIGIYGLVAYTTSQRTGEFGIRVALGAVRADIVRLVVWRAALLAIGGTLVGCIAALAVTRFAAGMLYGVPPNDAATFAVVAALLICTGALAGYAPARRAAAADPMRALRAE